MKEINVIYELYANATSSIELGDTVTNILFPLLVVGIGVGIMALLFFVSGNISKYRRVKNLFHFLYKCFSYSAYGMLTVAVVGIPCFVGWNALQYVGNNPEGSLEFFKWVGIIVGALVGFGVVGYITKNRIWKRIFKYHRIESDAKQKPVEKGLD